MAYFRHYLDYGQKNWTDSIPIAQYALNDAESSTTGHTPNFITFGTQRIGGTDKRDNEQGTTYTQRTYGSDPQRSKTGHGMEQKNYKKLLRRETSGIVYFEGRGTWFIYDEEQAERKISTSKREERLNNLIV